jgi:diadenosine tetraphosphate (Ap4A) HIT family hydrolase
MQYICAEMAQNMTEDQNPGLSGKFHWLHLGDQVNSENRYDSIIFETEHFVVLPSLGSLVTGWLLVLPKTPLCRIADLNNECRHEFEVLVHHCIDQAEREFGQAFVFEHGGNQGSKISCGVDQAHLHIVPLDFDLLRLAKQSTPQSCVSQDGLVFPYDICGRDEYWYVSDQKQTAAITVTEPQSQWFRKLIARQTGQDNKWNYKEYPFLDNIDQTLESVGVDGAR